MIYGVAAISGCMLIGNFIGDFLGSIIGIEINVGGVGFSMILLLIISDRMSKKKELDDAWKSGIKYWKSMYIPIVVAMAASQDMYSAISHGFAAILAGVLAVTLTFFVMAALFYKGVLQ